MAKSPLIRKLSRLHLKLERLLYQGMGSGNAVLINSFPKSGTHLLSQIFENQDAVRDFGYFLNNASSWRFKERSVNEVNNMVYGIKKGELVRGHLWYSNTISSILEEKNVKTFFIYRDLRDVIVSEAYYLSRMNRWHALHKYFAPYKGDINAAISLAIEGLPDGGPTGLYQNIAKRFEPFVGWISDENTFSIQFESLINVEEQLKLVTQIMSYYCGTEKVNHRLLEKSLTNIQPKKSHTFRKGSSGQWVEQFSELHKDKFKEIAGRLLVDLGYEDDLDW